MQDFVTHQNEEEQALLFRINALLMNASAMLAALNAFSRAFSQLRPTEVQKYPARRTSSLRESPSVTLR